MLKYQQLLEQISLTENDRQDVTHHSSDCDFDASPRARHNTMFYVSSGDDDAVSSSISDGTESVESAASYCRVAPSPPQPRPPPLLPVVPASPSPNSHHSPLRFPMNATTTLATTTTRPVPVMESTPPRTLISDTTSKYLSLPTTSNTVSGPSFVSALTPLQSSTAGLTNSGLAETSSASAPRHVLGRASPPRVEVAILQRSPSSSMGSFPDYGSVASETPSAMRERWLHQEPLFGPVVESENGSAVTSGRSSRRTSWVLGKPASPVLATPFAKRREQQRTGVLLARRRCIMMGAREPRRSHTTASTPIDGPVSPAFPRTARQEPHIPRKCSTGLAVTARGGLTGKVAGSSFGLPPVVPRTSPGSPMGPPSTPGRGGRQLSAMVEDDDDDDSSPGWG